MINPMVLTGKHILITGGSSGIGRECAIQASRLGAKVTIVARNAENLKQTIELMDEPSRHAMYDFDLTKTEDIELLINKIIRERGAVDGFCHAAGIGTARMLKISKPKFTEKMFRIHFFAFIEIIRALSLKENLNSGASIIGISSVAAHKGGIGQSVYSAVKASMEGVISSIAMELGIREIRVNTVSFAMVDTAMYQEFLEYSGDSSLMKKQYLGVIDTKKAANIVVFLLSDACPYITASDVPVWAGC